MGKLKFGKSGYILLDLIVVLLIMGVLEILIVPQIKSPDIKAFNFMNEYLLSQTYALKNAENLVMDTSDYQLNTIVSFNESGNINQAKTIYIENNKAIITLGMGRIHLEK